MGDAYIDVRAVFNSDIEDHPEGLSKLSKPEDLHQYALNGDVNDGVLPALAIVKNKACDQGTALYLFWQFRDCLGNLDSYRKKSPSFNVAAVIDVINERFESGFATSDIYYDPVKDHEMTASERKALLAEGVIPAERFEKIGKKKIKKVWLYDEKAHTEEEFDDNLTGRLKAAIKRIEAKKSKQNPE